MLRLDKETSMHYVITKEMEGEGGSTNGNLLLRSVLKIITKGKEGGQKTQNLNYVLHGWSLKQ